MDTNGASWPVPPWTFRKPMNKSLDNTGIMGSWSLFLCSKKSLADSSRCKQAPFFFCPTSRETGRLPRTSKTLEIWHRFASLSWRACPGTKRKPSKQWMMMVDLAVMSGEVQPQCVEEPLDLGEQCAWNIWRHYGHTAGDGVVLPNWNPLNLTQPYTTQNSLRSDLEQTTNCSAWDFSYLSYLFALDGLVWAEHDASAPAPRGNCTPSGILHLAVSRMRNFPQIRLGQCHISLGGGACCLQPFCIGCVLCTQQIPRTPLCHQCCQGL